MKKNFTKALIISMLSLYLGACKTLSIEKPKESYLPSNIDPVLSELPLRIELDIKKLETSVNKKLTGVLFEGNKLSNQDLSLKITKVQNFTFNINNNTIEYRVPLKVWSRFAWKVEKFGFSVGDYYDANGTIALKYKTTISFTKNWQLVGKTTAAGFEWIETPKISVAGVNVPVTPIANLALQNCEKIITAQIDKTLAENVDIKKYANLAWTEIQKPQQVNPEHNIWLRISPKDIYAIPFSTNGNKLSMGLALYAQVESFMGAKPEEKKTVNLPIMKFVNNPAQAFSINIGVDITFAKIAELAKKELLNKTFSEGNKTISIKDLSIFGSDGKAVFVADVIGSLKGRIYFTGNLEYNPAKTAVEITNPEFDIKTSNALVKSAGWLLHGLILKKLSPYLTYPIKNELQDAKLRANTFLKNYTLTEGINLQGNMTKISVEKLNLVPGAVRAQTNLKGTINIKVDDINF